MADCVRQRCRVGGFAEDVHRDGEDARRHDAEIEPQLLVCDHRLETPQQQEVVEPEVHAEEQHEHRRDVLRRVGVGSAAGVQHAEAARARRAERDAHRVERRHSGQQQRENVHHRQSAVDEIQDLR